MRESVAGQYRAPCRADDRAEDTSGGGVASCLSCLPAVAHSAPREASPPDPSGFRESMTTGTMTIHSLLTDTAAVRELPLVAADPACLGFWPVLGGSASVVPTRFLARPPAPSPRHLTAFVWVRVTTAHCFIPRRHARGSWSSRVRSRAPDELARRSGPGYRTRQIHHDDDDQREGTSLPTRTERDSGGRDPTHRTPRGPSRPSARSHWWLESRTGMTPLDLVTPTR